MIDVIEQKRQQLKELNAQIVDRQRYFRDQEILINDLIHVGNTELMGLSHDIKYLRAELRDIKTDIRTARLDYSLLQEDLVSIRKELVLATNGMVIGYA